MNKFVFISLVLPFLLSAQDVSIHVVNRSGEPVEDAEVRVFYERVGQFDQSQTKTGKTDEGGLFKCSGSAELCLFFSVQKEGYYSYGKLPAKKDELCGRPEKVEKVIQISKQINPIPLFATFDVREKVPLLSEWCGYDFEQQDWVEPNGNGKVSDIIFRVKREFVGFNTKGHWQRTLEERREFSKKAHAARDEEWTEEKFRLRSGDWNTHLEIAFPNEKEGLVKVVDEFKPHSLLHMPHQAPVDSYEASYAYEIKNYERYTLRDDIGFFLRTRVVLDEDGNIESANYAKIHGDFKVNHGGGISFTYYFNPVPNDRNLEFDPKQNLFSEGTSGTLNLVLP